MDFINLTKKQVDEQIARLKKKHNLKVVFVLKVTVDDEGKETAFGFAKKPPRALMGAAMSFAAEDPMKSDEVMLEGIWLDGDDRIKTDDDMFMSARMILTEIITIRKASIEKK